MNLKRLLSVALLALVGSAFAAELTTSGKIVTPIALPGGKDGKATLSGLQPEALQIGLGDAVLIGATEIQKAEDGTSRVGIRWHSVGLSSNPNAVQPLQSPLRSQFRTADKSVTPNTEVSIRGDLDLLAEDFLKLKAKKDTPRDIQRQTNNNNTETSAAKNANELGSSGSGGGSGGGMSNAPYSLSNTNDQMKTDLITTQWQSCQPRIDRTGHKVYEQARKLEVTQSGKLMNSGECQDHGATADIQTQYDNDCKPVVDVANMKVFHQFKSWAQLNGATIEVNACTADFNKFDPIIATNDQCGYRHDFTAGKSILQERLYYNDLAGKMISVRDCGDSTTAFAQYNTENTCTPTLDQVNKQVFINIRVAFMDGNGKEQYATECKPDGNPSFPVLEAFCDPKYEHDFTNHVSYYRTKPYYVDKTGNTIYLAACARSALTSFSHIYNTGSCTAQYDDANLLTHWYKTTEIQTPDDGTITIAPCAEVGSPTPYAFTGESTTASNTNLGNQGAVSAKVRIPTANTADPNVSVTFNGRSSVNRDCYDSLYWPLVLVPQSPALGFFPQPNNGDWTTAFYAGTASYFQRFSDGLTTYLTCPGGATSQATKTFDYYSVGYTTTITWHAYLRPDGTKYVKEARRNYNFYYY